MPATCVSLFSGAGGFDIGLESAGFSVVAAVEADPDCIETLRLNQASRIPVPNSEDGRVLLDATRVLHARVEEMTRGDLVPNGASASWRPDLLAGGPPCQPFSASGKQRSLGDPRGVLFREFVRIAEELRPRAILFENVRGLITARGPSGRPGGALRLVLRAFQDIGYATRVGVLNAADYALPQRRVRFFLLAAQRGPLAEFPRPTHARADRPRLFDEGLPWMTLGEFLAKQPEPHPEEIVRPSLKLAKLLRDIRAGSGLRSPGVSEPTRPGGHWGYKQGTFVANPELPARTVTAAATQDWIRQADGSLRRLTLRECSGLQGFPVKWQFVGSSSSRYRQVGNAVPVRFGEVLGSALLAALSSTSPGRATVSAPVPASIGAAIDYTIRDDARNGVARPRSGFFRGADR